MVTAMVTQCNLQFEYDPERLIEEMKKRPALWNYMDVNYKSMAARVTLWNEIANALLDPNVKLSSGETRELVAQLQKKWKGVKDAYIKYLANPNKSKKKPYVYSRQLEFLNHRSTKYSEKNDSVSDNGPSRKKKKIQKSTVTVKMEEESSDEEEDNCNENEEYLEVPFIDDKKQVSAKPEEFAFANVESILKTPEGEDCDKMFLLSLLPHLKSIPVEKRLGAKMKLLEVLQQANM